MLRCSHQYLNVHGFDGLEKFRTLPPLRRAVACRMSHLQAIDFQKLLVGFFCSVNDDAATCPDALILPGTTGPPEPEQVARAIRGRTSEHSTRVFRPNPSELGQEI